MADRRALREHFDGPYADFWREQAVRYGHGEGHQRLIDLVSGLVPEGGLLLDCAMGTGFPFTRVWSARSLNQPWKALEELWRVTTPGGHLMGWFDAGKPP